VLLWRVAAVVFLAALGIPRPAAAQTTSRPGPFSLDVRAVTSPVPPDPLFYPRLDASALVPDRGFGGEVGAHVYLLNLGPARLGIGASLFIVRATTTPAPAPPPSSGTPTGRAGQSVQVDQRLLTPQVSFNFGTGDGWSYLSAGAGRTAIVTRTAGSIAGRRETSSLNALNVGGGARWFLKSHLGVGFDIRLHLVGAGTAGAIAETAVSPPTTPLPPAAPVPPSSTPSLRMLTVSGGFSFK
jgi:hypothetical protein